MTLSWWPCHKIVSVTFTFLHLHLHLIGLSYNISFAFETPPKNIHIWKYLFDSIACIHRCPNSTSCKLNSKVYFLYPANAPQTISPMTIPNARLSPQCSTVSPMLNCLPNAACLDCWLSDPRSIVMWLCTGCTELVSTNFCEKRLDLVNIT